MKFISLTTMIMSAAVLAGIVTAQVPDGKPCAQTEQYECGRLAGYNRGYPFLFFCSSQNFVEVVKTCNCGDCCWVYKGGVGDDGYFGCTCFRNWWYWRAPP
ncbi:hypothetical protein BDR03DRAFT_999570 [Suillus americanus]|nr:hypothetical protein BDR03DRAFT_999570 [Suillus americanus]